MSVKWKFNDKSFGKNCQTLKDLERNLSNKEVAKKIDVPKNSISTLTKNKTCFAALQRQIQG